MNKTSPGKVKQEKNLQETSDAPPSVFTGLHSFKEFSHLFEEKI